MPRRVVTFDRFDGGEFSLLGEREAPRGSWTGTNVVRYLDGSLGPRSGLVDLGLTGAATGEVLAFGHHNHAQKLWYVVGTGVYQFPDTALAQANVSTGSLFQAPTNRIKPDYAADYSFMISLDDKQYYIDHATATLVGIAATPGARVIAWYGERLIVAGTSGATQNRVYFSAAADGNTWPAANYFDVGFGGTIIGLWASRDRLTIVKDDGTWWILTGVPGVSDVLRRVTSSAIVPGTAYDGISRQGVSGSSKVWFLPEFGEYPAYFSGTTVRTMRHLSLTANGESFSEATVANVGVTGLTQPEDMLFTTGQLSTSYDNQGLLFQDGVWTKHVFGKKVSGLIEGKGDVRKRAFLCDGGAPATAPKFYALQHSTNRPPFSGYTWESKTDAGTAFTSSFTLPAWWHEVEGELLVAGVVVDFRKWNHGYGGNNTFTVSITPLRIDGGTGTVVSGSFSEAASVPTGGINGEDDSFTAAFSNVDATGEGVRVALTGLVGVAIQRVRVLLDTLPLEATDSSA